MKALRKKETEALACGYVAPHFVCRVAGAAADNIDALRGTETVQTMRTCLAVEVGLREQAEELSMLLYNVIRAVTEPSTRSLLIALRRDLYNLRVPPRASLGAVLATLRVETRTKVQVFLSQVERLQALTARVKTIHDRELPVLRGHFRQSLSNTDFRNALLLSSPSLYGRMDGYTEGSKLRSRQAKIERGLLRYYTRMTMKATPFSTFCTIVPGRFVNDRGDWTSPISFRGDLHSKRSYLRINKRLYGFLWEYLKQRRAVRRCLPVELNPTLHAENTGRLVYLTSVRGIEVFQRLDNSEVLELITARCRDAVEPTVGELVNTLCGNPQIDTRPEEAETFIDKLVEIGFLRLQTGIREQEVEWDLPLRALLDRVDDDHARQASALLCKIRECMTVYAHASVEERAVLLNEVREATEVALEGMGISERVARDVLFYEDTTAKVVAEVALEPEVHRALDALDEWVRLTSCLAWPRTEQANMRHFFDNYYDREAKGIPLLEFYEDFYREHLKAHVEKERKQGVAGNQGTMETYDAANPFNLDLVRNVVAGRRALAERVRARWAESPNTEVIDLDASDIREVLCGVPPPGQAPRSIGAFAVLFQGEEDWVSLVLHSSSYTTGFGKYFSRFLYMFPRDFQEEIRSANAALSTGHLAEICGDAHFNANLHPPLLPWEIGYPTGEGGATHRQLRSADLVVERDPKDAHALRLRHAHTRKTVIPVDLGFLNPLWRPPLYQLLSHFTPPAIFAPTLPDQPIARAAASGRSLPSADEATLTSHSMVTRGGPQAEAEHGPGIDGGILVQPRLTYRKALILRRRCWRVPGRHFPQLRPDEGAAEFYLRANRWREEYGVPERVYVHIFLTAPLGASMPLSSAKDSRDPDAVDEEVERRRTAVGDLRKPQYMDFGSPLLVELLGRMASGLGSFVAVLEEQLPTMDALPRIEGRPYVTELILQLYYPADLVPEAALRCSSADAAAAS